MLQTSAPPVQLLVFKMLLIPRIFRGLNPIINIINNQEQSYKLEWKKKKRITGEVSVISIAFWKQQTIAKLLSLLCRGLENASFPAESNDLKLTQIDEEGDKGEISWHSFSTDCPGLIHNQHSESASSEIISR